MGVGGGGDEGFGKWITDGTVGGYFGFGDILFGSGDHRMMVKGKDGFFRCFGMRGIDRSLWRNLGMEV